MAQCEAEGRKHPTMDLYVGIFNSKLYASSRGSARMGSVDKRSMHGFNATSANVENVRDDVSPPDRSSFQSRSFRDGNKKPPVLSDYGRPDRKLASLSNVGSMMRTSSTDVTHGGYLNKSPPPDLHAVNKASNPQSDVVYGVNSLQGDLNYHAGDRNSEMKSATDNMGHGLSEKSVKQANVGFSSNEKNTGLDVRFSGKTTDAGYVGSIKNSSHAQSGDHSKGMESSKAVVHLVSEKNDVLYATNLKSNPPSNQSQRNVEIKAQMGLEAGFDTSRKDAKADEEHYMLPEHDATGSKVMKIHKFSQVVTGIHDVTSNGNDQVDVEYLRSNGYARKSQDLSVTTGSSLLPGAGLGKEDKARDIFAARRSFSSNNELHRFERTKASVSLADGTVFTSDVEVMAPNSLQSGDMTSGLVVENYCTRGSQNQRKGEQNVGVFQASGTGISGIGGVPSGKTGELVVRDSSMNGCIKIGTTGEAEGIGRELALKDSPDRSLNHVPNLRVGGSASTDSSSSHGGSSHSGSPTAAENLRESRVSSFGNILLSKGSPRSVSSRSMGSASISGNGSLAPGRSSFIDSPASQFRYSTSSGRKSAELVPNRRYSEIVPNRKSSEMLPNGHVRGAAMQGCEGDGMFGSGSSRNMSNGISLSNGNLLVGSGDGNVLSVGGAIKSNSKQADVVNYSNMVDCTLLKKAQASLDPEEIKNAGNEYYRRGHFSEALMLYTKAVNLLPGNAAYRSNRAAALSAMGRLGDAVKECKDAIDMDSSYTRAHQRVAALYLRLGLMEKAKQHIYTAGQQTDVEVQRLRNIDEHMSRCLEARKRGQWANVIRESDAAVVAGADSAPQIFGYKSEALLGLHRPDEADAVCAAAQRVESSLIKSGVLQADTFLLTVRAQVDMALGRFEGAFEAAKSAAKIDPYNENVAALLRKAQAVCHTRTTGNKLFKAGRFFEALALYAEGLESDPMNAVLLCNRAACRSKLGQWEKAVEDCDAALRIQPNYTKALMRRANSWTKLERWEDALQDYELLRRKMPEDLEVARGLFDVQVAMKKSQGEDTHKMKFGGDVEEVLSDEQFQEAITSPGLSVVQFVTKWSERCRQLAPFVDDLCKRNPCVNFLRVDVDENPDLAKFESVSFIPTFKIYKSGQKVKEILGPTEQSLEYALKHYTL